MDIHSGFHVYGVEWDENSCTFYVDGMVTAVYTGEGVPRVEEFLLLSSEYLPKWVEVSIKKATLPLEYEVDWIRAYSGK